MSYSPSSKEPSYRNNWIFFFLLILLISIPLFSVLSHLPIRLWDESRLATNALEMSRHNNWLIPTFDGEPDMWNTKPPLLIWMQAILIKLLGVSPLAIRLPVAIAAAITCIYLFFLLRKITGNNLFPLIAVLVLVTTEKYVTEHAARTGDYDGLLILFTTLFCFSYFQYLTFLKNKYLYFFFIFMGLAVLTKSIAGLIFLPGSFVFTLLEGKLKKLLLNKHFYLGIILFLLIGCSYYLIREIYNPGYIKVVYENELGGRFLKTIENHQNSFFFYFKFRDYSYWLPFLAIGILLGFTQKNTVYKRLFLFSLIMGFSFLFIISCSQTKLDWYDVPAFPFFAIIVAIVIYRIYLFLSKKLENEINWKRYIPLGVVCLLFVYPYFHTLSRQVFFPKEASWEKPWYRLSWYLKDMVSGKNNVKINSVIIEDYQPQVSFGIEIANENGFSINATTSNDVQPGTNILIDREDLIEKIEQRFYTKTKFEQGEVKVLYIEREK